MNKLTITLLLFAISIPAVLAADQLSWEELPSLPDELGVAGPFAGVHGDALIVAGGANFPRPVWENEKGWRDWIFVLTNSDDELIWRVGGRLARPIAYGAAVSTPDGVVCMGGNDAKTTFDNVFLLTWDASAESVTTTEYPSLPEPCAYGAAALVGDVIYLAGGQNGQSLESAMTNFWALDLSQKGIPAEFVWRELPSWPGRSRALNLTVHQHNGTNDCVYVISGRRQESPASDSVEFLKDVWEYTPATGQWRERADAPRCVMAGTAIGDGRNQIFVLGGADGSLFFKGDELKDEHPGFPQEAIAFDTVSNNWSSAGATPRNHVTTVAVKWEGGIIIPTGEVRPRVRSPKVWRVTRTETAAEKVDLFEAGKDGYARYRIPGIVVTKQGTVLAYCEARKKQRGDWGPIDVMMRRSTDGGRTWLPRQKIVHIEGDLPVNPLAAAQNLDRPGDNTVNNPLAIVDHETAAVHFLYCLEYMRCFYMRSADDGVTWTEPVEITRTFEDFRSDYDWKVLATGPAHGIQLTHGPHRGRLVVPVWLSLGTGGHAHRPSVTATIYSDDHGKTWKRGDIAVPDTPEFIFPNETIAVQLSDGSVMLNSRSESKRHRRLVTISPDGATNWSEPRFDQQLLDPICMAGMTRVREGVIAFSNPHNLSRVGGKQTPGTIRDRKNVSIKLSYDEGKTWSASRTLEPGVSGYSDLAALSDGTILCFYERGTTDGKDHYRTGRLTVARVTEDWVRDGIETDVCVYGGSSGGVVAAVQAARMGKRVVLVEPRRHLGGMMAGGLSWSDVGSAERAKLFGGLAREVFERIGKHYGQDPAKVFDIVAPKSEGRSRSGVDFIRPPSLAFEPKVAERVFNELVHDAGVTVLLDSPARAVVKKGARIVRVELEDRGAVAAKMFIDATYEGDLMALAGVSYTVGRESNAQYGETGNGVRGPQHGPSSGRFSVQVDPYVKAGDPTSGLLPLIAGGAPEPLGSADKHIQSYNYRLCLTDDPANRAPLDPPANYDPAHWELLGRYIVAMTQGGKQLTLRSFCKYDPLPNRKFDFNNRWPISTDMLGGADGWPEGTTEERARIARAHEDYLRGFFHFLRTDPRVPAHVREETARFGLPKDEFADNGNWPHQLYVREARRMVSDFVMTEHHIRNQRVAPDGISLATYPMDIHAVRRVFQDGKLYNEGFGGGSGRPAPIGYGAIVPKATECENLFVTFALSASHAAFGSIRMEPVFMVTSQSAATAACLAIDASARVQDVDRARLRVRLLANGQILAASAPSTAAPSRFVPSRLAGIVQDDNSAEYQGSWSASSAQPSPIGDRYRHDQNTDRGKKSATFTVMVPAAGDYEIRLLYSWHQNRSTKTKVTVEGGPEAKTVRINQREPALVNGVPVALGTFRFEAGARARVTVSNEGADGYVVVDGLQFLPVEMAREERAGKRPSGYAKRAPENNPPPVLLKTGAGPDEVNGKSYDLVVIGGTPGGIACAVRAARERLSVLLVHHTLHLGGFITSGAGGWEAPYDGLRSPIYGEMLTDAAAYYRDRYGEGSPQHLASMPSRTSRGHIDRPKIEPRIAEMLFNQMVEKEKSLTVLLGHVVTKVERDGALLKTVTLKPMHGEDRVTVQGNVFADCMYEGDLMAAACVRTQIGRESRAQYGEKHAGVIYTKKRRREPGQRGSPKAADEGALNIRYNPNSTAEIVEGPQSGEADSSVMAYNYRLILTRDPTNRIAVSKPADYDVALAKAAGSGGFVPNLPNGKVAWNGGRLIGPQNDYPDGDWATREAISKRYLNAMLMRLWWLQNDPEVSERERSRFAGYGLAADEFPDNDHAPYEIYVREARRLVGRYVFKEHDNVIAGGIARTPIHSDSIAITDWPMDSVACLPREVPGGSYDGVLFLGEESRPAQVPYRSLLPVEVDNLLVPVALSASHVGWGAIRLEPVWMQTGESAGFAAALAVKGRTTPAALDPDTLIRKLATSRVMISFFNDLDVTSDDPRVPAAQYFGTRGFFANYDARLDEPLTEAVRRAWREGLTGLRGGRLNTTAFARQVHRAEAADSPQLVRTRGEAMLSMWRAVSGGTSSGAANGAASASPRRVSLKVQPVRSSSAAEVRGKTYDVVVIGASPGGIASAVRAAREGLSVLLVQRNKHIGGMLTNGLMQWDALYGGPRSPIFNEYAKSIEDYYRKTYGPDSPQFRQARYSQQHYPMSRFECGVAEHLFNQLVSAEPNITTLLSHYPADIHRDGAALKTLTLRKYGTTNDIAVTGATYVDATYEGDLAALAKVPYRVGREGHDEYGEPHAGKIFTNISKESGPQDAKDGKLNIHPYSHSQGTIDPDSPRTADRAVQGYNYRFSLSNEQGNIRLPEKPPGYDRERYVDYYRLFMSAGRLNGKASFNAAVLPGEGHAYPEATWPERETIIERHKNFALGLMWFLQNDESVRPESRERYRRIGLPLDEFPDNENIPYEMYVREARRIVGRHVFTEHDNRPAPGLTRTPIHPDSIAFTDWTMDSHDCTWDRSPGYAFDGKLILTEESRPAQIPWRSLLPQGVDNLIVPVCLGATHVAWGAVRLEPVWMMTGEAAGFAAALAKGHGTTPCQLDPDLLLRALCEERHFVSFFNDLEAAAVHPAMPAAQYFATRGFFPDYDARLDEPLTEAVRRVWEEGLTALREGRLDAMALSRQASHAEVTDSPKLERTRGDAMLSMWHAISGKHRRAAIIEPLRAWKVGKKLAPLVDLSARHDTLL
jgi:N-acetylneuraminic acid mutarotase/flavin-dependent dehydrogenase